MSTVSQLPVWISALVSTMRATTGYRSPATVGTTIPVFDGPEFFLTDEPASSALIIGWPGDDADWAQAATSVQAWRIAGANRPREETGTLTCRAQYQAGDASIQAGSVAAARTGAASVLGDVETVIRANPNLGTALATNMVQITGIRLTQWLDTGVCCALDFDLQIYNPRM